MKATVKQRRCPVCGKPLKSSYLRKVSCQRLRCIVKRVRVGVRA